MFLNLLRNGDACWDWYKWTANIVLNSDQIAITEENSKIAGVVFIINSSALIMLTVSDSSATDRNITRRRIWVFRKPTHLLYGKPERSRARNLIGTRALNAAENSNLNLRFHMLPNCLHFPLAILHIRCPNWGRVKENWSGIIVHPVLFESDSCVRSHHDHVYTVGSTIGICR